MKTDQIHNTTREAAAVRLGRLRMRTRPLALRRRSPGSARIAGALAGAMVLIAAAGCAPGFGLSSGVELHDNVGGHEAAATSVRSDGELSVTTIGVDMARHLTVDGDIAYVTQGPLGVSRIDLSSGNTDWQVAADRVSRGVSPALSPDAEALVAVDELGLMALDARTGTEQWRVGLEAPAGAEKVHSPVYAGDVVFGATHKGTLAAIDAESGDVRWRRQVLEDPGTHWLIGRVAATADRAFVMPQSPFDAALVCFDAGGNEAWRVALEGPVSAPAIVHGELVVGAGYDGVHAYDPADGRLLWQADTVGAFTATVAAVAYGDMTVVFDRVGSVIALRDGAPVWVNTFWTTFTNAQPVVAAGLLWVTEEDPEKGTLWTALDQDGDVVHELRIQGTGSTVWGAVGDKSQLVIAAERTGEVTIVEP